MLHPVQNMISSTVFAGATSLSIGFSRVCTEDGLIEAYCRTLHCYLHIAGRCQGGRASVTENIRLHAATNHINTAIKNPCAGLMDPVAFCYDFCSVALLIPVTPPVRLFLLFLPLLLPLPRRLLPLRCVVFTVNTIVITTSPCIRLHLCLSK